MRLLHIALMMLLSGCSLFEQTSKPSEITLVQAMHDVGEGLREMKEAQGSVRTGLIASDVSVTFNISAGDTKNGNLTVDLARSPTDQITKAEVGGGIGSTSTSQRGNTITIKFVNLLTIPKDTLAYGRSVRDVAGLVETASGAATIIWSAPETSTSMITPTTNSSKEEKKKEADISKLSTEAASATQSQQAPSTPSQSPFTPCIPTVTTGGGIGLMLKNDPKAPCQSLPNIFYIDKLKNPSLPDSSP